MAEKAVADVRKPSLEKLKALQLAMDKIDKDHGKGAIMRMGDNKVEDIAGMIQNCGDELRQFSGFPYVWSAQQLQNYRYTEMNEVLFRMLDIIVAKQ